MLENKGNVPGIQYSVVSHLNDSVMMWGLLQAHASSAGFSISEHFRVHSHVLLRGGKQKMKTPECHRLEGHGCSLESEHWVPTNGDADIDKIIANIVKMKNRSTQSKGKKVQSLPSLYACWQGTENNYFFFPRPYQPPPCLDFSHEAVFIFEMKDKLWG